MTQSTRFLFRLIAVLIFGLCTTHVGAQTLATYSLGSGLATFGLSLPRGAAVGGVRVGSFETQTDVKTTWPDGSIRFAIVTAKVESSGTYAITPGPAASGTLTPRWPSASVIFDIGGTRYTAVLPPFDDSNSWLSNGPLVRESRVVVSPRAGSAHPLLQVIFDVRSYASGDHRVDVTVQNVKDVPEGNAVTYDVSVSLNGTTVYRKDNVGHAYLTRWRKVFATSGLDLATVTTDLEPFFASGAIPRFLNSVVNPSYGALNDDRFDVLNFGDMNPSMPAPGSRPEIGFYPYWTAQYIVHRSTGMLNYMLKQGDLSGSWSGHITEPDGTSQVTLERHPNYWFDPRSLGRPNGPHVLNGTTHMLETAHLPSLTYVPYLVTGDRYYVDQLKFWANFVMLSTWPLDPAAARTPMGIIVQNQVRGIAWGLRAIGDCVASLPDNDPEKPYFSSRLQANLDWLDEHAQSVPVGSTEAIFIGKFGTDTGGWTPPYRLRVAPWMNGYVAWALDHLGDLGFAPVDKMRDRLLRFNYRMFTDRGYDRSRVGPYFLNVAAIDASGAVRYYTMSETFCETFGCPPRADSLTPLAGYYGIEARAMLILAGKHGLADVREPLAWLESQPGVMDDVNARSGLALSADTSAGPTRRPPPTAPPPAPGRRPSAPRNLRIVP